MNDDEDDASSVTTLHSDDTPCVSVSFQCQIKFVFDWPELENGEKNRKNCEKMTTFT